MEVKFFLRTWYIIHGSPLKMWAFNLNAHIFHSIVSQFVWRHTFNLKQAIGDLPGCPVGRTLLPLQGVWVLSLVREIRSHTPHKTAKIKKKKQVIKQGSYATYEIWREIKHRFEILLYCLMVFCKLEQVI